MSEQSVSLEARERMNFNLTPLCPDRVTRAQVLSHERVSLESPERSPESERVSLSHKSVSPEPIEHDIRVTRAQDLSHESVAVDPPEPREHKSTIGDIDLLLVLSRLSTRDCV